jgi:biopolymer transport protein ExbB/TolQ
MIQGIGYYLTHPDAILFAVASALLYPVLFTEVICLVYVVVAFGWFTGESIVRLRRRSLEGIEKAGLAARAELAAGRPVGAAAALATAPGGALLARFTKKVAADGRLERPYLLKTLADLESYATARLERTRVLVRVGPMLGLMGTLIPISPALVGLAKGDIQALASNLVVAFSATVIGLLIGGLSYIMTAVRDRQYTQDISDIEYLLDTMGAPR